ncbi:cellulose synthase operon protein YhjQ/BcsQ [Silvibacterium sp.]|uniref:cellulose synthase operon protein YhjQ/BcsQ n=1 Tax=Silvibacterium sp. TaxID=1964179 RepID=UPI0039E652B8
MSADKRNASQAESDSAPILPEDIATLYSWANLHGIKYRDFSATRQDFRSQPRAPRPDQEPDQAVEAEAAQAVPAAEPLEDVLEATAPRPEALEAENNEPVPVEQIEAVALVPEVKKEIAEPAVAAEEIPSQPVAFEASAAQDYAAPKNTESGAPEAEIRIDAAAGPASAVASRPEQKTEAQSRTIARGPWAELLGAELPGDKPAKAPAVKDDNPTLKAAPVLAHEVLTEPPAKAFVAEPAAASTPASAERSGNGYAHLPPSMLAEPAPAKKQETPGRERTSSRWYALNRIAGHLEPHAHGEPALHAPVLAVFSLAGGVGKTGLVATLGRALASRGEDVLLVDTNPYGLLHLYYGAQAPKPGVVRSFTGGGQDAAVQMLSLDAFTAPTAKLGDLLQQNSQGVSRILVDVATASVELVKQLARFTPQVLVPLTPDLHSLGSLQALEDFFARIEESEGRRLEPVYLINGFDPALSLHLEIREILAQRLGDRLLPFALHRSAAVAEALAEGMTVVDYSPGALVAEDYASLASWARRLAAPADGARRGRRWSEQERS